MIRTRASLFLLALALLELVVLGTIFYYVPEIRRPFEVMLGVIAGFSLLQLPLARGNVLRAVLLVLFSLAGSLFALEMADKYFNITALFERGRASPLRAEANALPWRPGNFAEYFAAVDKARASGLHPEALEQHFAGDIFAGMDQGSLVVESSNDSDGLLANVSLKPFRTFGFPLGYELTPDNTVRSYFIEKQTGRPLFDGKITSGPAGERTTRGNARADSTYVFFGCSVTFGYGLNDDQTLAHYFSEAGGFRHNVVNLALSGYGPNHALRDLEQNYHMGKMGIDPATVKGVFFGLIDGHSVRVVQPTRGAESPYYELNAAGRAEYKGGYMENLGQARFGRLFAMMNKSRLYPKLREKFMLKKVEEEKAEQWRVTIAILAEMNRICRERYGVGLTVLYWDGNPSVIAALRAEGVRVLLTSDYLEPDWMAKKGAFYLLYDYHPAAYLNKTLARPVYEAMTRGDAVPTTEKSAAAQGAARMDTPSDMTDIVGGRPATRGNNGASDVPRRGGPEAKV